MVKKLHFLQLPPTNETLSLFSEFSAVHLSKQIRSFRFVQNFSDLMISPPCSVGACDMQQNISIAFKMAIANVNTGGLYRICCFLNSVRYHSEKVQENGNGLLTFTCTISKKLQMKQ